MFLLEAQVENALGDLPADYPSESQVQKADMIPWPSPLVHFFKNLFRSTPEAPAL
jgi:hypothetical protein